MESIPNRGVAAKAAPLRRKAMTVSPATTSDTRNEEAPRRSPDYELTASPWIGLQSFCDPAGQGVLQLAFGDFTGQAQELKVVRILRHLLGQFGIRGSKLAGEVRRRRADALHRTVHHHVHQDVPGRDAGNDGIVGRGTKAERTGSAKGRCWDGHLYKVPVPLDNPVWYEWDERKEPSCNLGLVRIFGKVRTKVLSLGVVLLILGYIFNIGILITIGWILAVIGLVLFVLGAIGRPLAGRRYWY